MIWGLLLILFIVVVGIWLATRGGEKTVEERQMERRLKQAALSDERRDLIRHYNFMVEDGKLLDVYYSADLPHDKRLVEIDPAAWNSLFLVAELKRARALVASRACKWRKRQRRYVKLVAPSEAELNELNQMGQVLCGATGA
jgi:hypothetical protein